MTHQLPWPDTTPEDRWQRYLDMAARHPDLSLRVLANLLGTTKSSLTGMRSRRGLAKSENNPVCQSWRERQAPVSLEDMPREIALPKPVKRPDKPEPTDHKPPTTSHKSRQCTALLGEPGEGQRWRDVDRCPEPCLPNSSWCEFHESQYVIKRRRDDE